jgi:hypothetical protein
VKNSNPTIYTKFLSGMPEGKGLLGRTKGRWKYVKMDLRAMRREQ